MKQTSTVAAIVINTPITIKCEGCKKKFEFKMNEDCFIYIPDGSVRLRCPHCGQVHRINLTVEKVKGE